MPLPSKELLGLGARTATISTDDQQFSGAKGGHFIINVTAGSGFNVTPKIEGKFGSTYYTILTGAAITTTGITVLKVYPGLSASPNAAANDMLPRVWRVTMTHLDGTSATYGVNAELQG